MVSKSVLRQKRTVRKEIHVLVCTELWHEPSPVLFLGNKQCQSSESKWHSKESSFNEAFHSKRKFNSVICLCTQWLFLQRKKGKRTPADPHRNTFGRDMQSTTCPQIQLQKNIHKLRSKQQSNNSSRKTRQDLIQNHSEEVALSLCRSFSEGEKETTVSQQGHEIMEDRQLCRELRASCPLMDNFICCWTHPDTAASDTLLPRHWASNRTSSLARVSIRVTVPHSFFQGQHKKHPLSLASLPIDCLQCVWSGAWNTEDGPETKRSRLSRGWSIGARGFDLSSAQWYFWYIFSGWFWPSSSIMNGDQKRTNSQDIEIELFVSKSACGIIFCGLHVRCV